MDIFAIINSPKLSNNMVIQLLLSNLQKNKLH